MTPVDSRRDDPVTDADLVRALKERAADNASIVYAHRVYSEIEALASRHGLPTPRSAIEIGPGVNLGSLFCFAASGVSALAAVDVAPLPEVPHSFYESLRDYILAVEGFSWWRPWAEAASTIASFPSLEAFPPAAALLERIDHRSGVSSEALPFGSGEFDLVYSVAALEHVPDPAGTVAEMRRVLAPGGLAINEIDLKHHGSADPLKFLEWDDDEWKRRTTLYGRDLSLSEVLDGSFGGEVFCNRFRRDEWIAVFRSEGFVVETVEPVILMKEELVLPDRFAEPFRSRPVEELRVLTMRVIARLP
jgi:SAM-dependent methyltransferase